MAPQQRSNRVLRAEWAYANPAIETLRVARAVLGICIINYMVILMANAYIMANACTAGLREIGPVPGDNSQKNRQQNFEIYYLNELSARVVMYRVCGRRGAVCRLHGSHAVHSKL